MILNCKFIIITCNVSAIRVRFTQSQFPGSEATGIVTVNLDLTGGSSAIPFNVTVTPSEQSPVSAEGNIVFIIGVSLSKHHFNIESGAVVDAKEQQRKMRLQHTVIRSLVWWFTYKET